MVRAIAALSATDLHLYMEGQADELDLVFNLLQEALSGSVNVVNVFKVKCYLFARFKMLPVDTFHDGQRVAIQASFHLNAYQGFSVL